MKKISIIYGTRPEYLKLKPLFGCFRDIFDMIIIKVNQHNNLIEDEKYDVLLDIEDISNDRLSNIGSNILKKLPEFINECTHVLVQGDTATAFYSSLCAYQMNKICIHLEAGMRTYDIENPFPEEGYRQMISRISDIHLCPSKIERDNLINEKVRGDIYIVGNTILDLVKEYNIPISRENKVLITLHRRENWKNYREYIIEIIKHCKFKNNLTFYFILHPNPQLKNILENENIPSNMILLDPLKHNELIKFLSSCNYIITDSGGIQEESNFLGKHVYLLRKITERNSISDKKITLVSLKEIELIEDPEKDNEIGYEYGDGNSSKEILRILETNFYKI